MLNIAFSSFLNMYQLPKLGFEYIPNASHKWQYAYLVFADRYLIFVFSHMTDTLTPEVIFPKFIL